MPDHFYTFRVGVDTETMADKINRYLTQSAHVVKSADQSVTSSTTFINDTHLTLNVSANTDYWLIAVITYAGSNGNFKHQWAIPTGASLLWVGDYLGNGETNSFGTISRTQHTATVTTAIAGGAASPTNQCSVPKGILRVGSSAGSVRLRWAQGSSSGTATTVRSGSILFLRRLQA
jgi:hypothetical protein